MVLVTVTVNAAWMAVMITTPPAATLLEEPVEQAVNAVIGNLDSLDAAVLLAFVV